MWDFEQNVLGYFGQKLFVIAYKWSETWVTLKLWWKHGMEQLAHVRFAKYEAI